MKKFIFTKFAGLQSYSWQLYSHKNSFTDISQQHFIPPSPNPPPVSIQAPPMFSTPLGSPGISAHWGDGKFCWEGNFLCGGWNLRRSDFDHSSLF